jgi:hypothetical protein
MDVVFAQLFLEQLPVRFDAAVMSDAVAKFLHRAGGGVRATLRRLGFDGEHCLPVLDAFTTVRVLCRRVSPLFAVERLA